MPPNVLAPGVTRSHEEIREHFFDLKTVEDVAEILEVPHGVLVYILYRKTFRGDYRTFEIAKKGGGVRQIAAPHPTIKILQSKLNTIFQAVYPAKPSVHGFVVGSNIVTNARRHVRKRFVLNVDLKDFFPSINFGRVRGMLMAKPYNLEPRAATVLAQICCHDGELPQGSPVSPIVSNMICAKMDSQLHKLARNNKCIYTRYADDITFSTRLRRFPEALAHRDGPGWSGESISLGEDLTNLIESNGFEVNPTKQRLQCGTGHQEVTGLTVNERPNVSKRFVRQIRAMLHAWEKFGLEDAEQAYHKNYDKPSRNPDRERPSFTRVVRGKLEFLRMVKGEGDPAYRKMRNKAHSIDPSFISAITEPPSDSNNPWSHWASQYSGIIFQLELRKDNGGLDSGTAFAWHRRALATAAHATRGRIRISPPFPPDDEIPPSSIITHPSGDERIDAAIVELPDGVTVPREFPVRTEPLEIGEEIAVLAFATTPKREPGLGFYPGVVESTKPYYGGDIGTIQVSAEISGGMSGGPVIDRWGKLVGTVMESTFEKTDEGVPGREFRHILPVRYLLDFGLK